MLSILIILYDVPLKRPTLAYHLSLGLKGYQRPFIRALATSFFTNLKTTIKVLWAFQYQLDQSTKYSPNTHLG